MYQMTKYLVRRLNNASEIDQAVTIDVFTRRMIKSMSRASAANLHKNRWFKVMAGVNALEPTFSERIGRACDKYLKRSKLGATRLKMLADLANRIGSDSLAVCFQSWVEVFREIDDMDFLGTVAYRNDVSLAQCGHFASRIHTIVGNEESPHREKTVCEHCARAMEDSPSYVSIGAYRFILARYAVEAIDYDGDRITIDRRNPNFRLVETRDRYEHVNYSPYQNLIDGYHSSKRKGFSLIESPWYRSHRRAFGCELEIQVRQGPESAAAGRVHEVLNPSGTVGEYCYFERDGSIGTGFELITQPAGLDVHREKFRLFLNNPDLKRGLRSHEGGSCGFHVHVGREYVTQAQIYRLQSFLNDVRNEALIRKIARRYANGFSKIKYEMAKLSTKGKANGDRYEALNVTGDHTIEFRIFRGSLRYESIIAALEFVNALLDFCAPGAVSFQDFNTLGFKKFVLLPDNRSDTKYLRSYLSLDENSDDEQRIAA